MTFGSLFAGIGGFDLGLERAGMKCVWQVEKDDYANRVLEKHWPNVRRCKDVCDFPPEPTGWECDLICGGFPCQDISLAGKNAGIEGERSGLWREFTRIVRILRPRYVVLENVAALLGRGLGDVLGDLADCGYDAEWSVLSACSVGAPHTRERLFIVSYPHGMFREEGMGFDADEFTRIQRGNPPEMQGDWLATVTANSGSANGIPDWSHRCRTLGNSIAPPVAEWIGRRIIETDVNDQ